MPDMSSEQAELLHATSSKDSRGSADGGNQWPLSPSASSSSGPTAGARGIRRLTPDTGSDDEEEDEYGDDVKDGAEGYELQEGVGRKDDDEDEGASSSFDDERRPRRQRQLYTPEEEQAVVRKFDRRLVVFMAFLYMLSFIDRSSTHPSLFHSTPESRANE